MTDTPAEVEAARALVAAYDALNSADHAADAQRLRELSISVAGRVEAYAAAQAALHAANAGACADGVPPAMNVDAARMFQGPFSGWEQGIRDDLADHDVVDLTDMTQSYADDDEHQTARANGADSNA
jgi:hypothetical protein